MTYQSKDCYNKIMVNNTKMLQLVLDKVFSVDKKVDKGFKSVDVSFNETNKRIDKLGIKSD